jgi:ABC-type cobalamin/Fe3+-siderophores transport system ATPase subunit
LKLQAERGITVILVTHDLPLARRHIGEAIWVHEGTLTQGPVKNLLEPKRVGEMLGIELE